MPPEWLVPIGGGSPPAELAPQDAAGSGDVAAGDAVAVGDVAPGPPGDIPLPDNVAVPQETPAAQAGSEQPNNVDVGNTPQDAPPVDTPQPIDNAGTQEVPAQAGNEAGQPADTLVDAGVDQPPQPPQDTQNQPADLEPVPNPTDGQVESSGSLVTDAGDIGSLNQGPEIDPQNPVNENDNQQNQSVSEDQNKNGNMGPALDDLPPDNLPPAPPGDWGALPLDTTIIFGIELRGPALVPWTKSKSWVFNNVRFIFM